MSSGTQTNLMDSDIPQRHLTAESVVLKPSLALYNGTKTRHKAGHLRQPNGRFV